MTMPTEAQRDAAEQLGRLAAREDAAITSCPFPVDGAGADRVLAARFVAGYVAAGGTVDGTRLDDELQDVVPESPQPTLYEHLGY